ncbi:hypothetical protein D3C80_1613080 [compost metagenome]
MVLCIAVATTNPEIVLLLPSISLYQIKPVGVYTISRAKFFIQESEYVTGSYTILCGIRRIV